MKTLPYYLTGVLLACMVHLSTGCPRFGWPKVDIMQIHAGAQAAEDAFVAGDTELLKTALTPEAQKRYEAQLPYMQASQMTGFGEAFKKRTLVKYSELYAVYSYSADGETFTAAFALQDDGSWKLMQF